MVRFLVGMEFMNIVWMATVPLYIDFSVINLLQINDT